MQVDVQIGGGKRSNVLMPRVLSAVFLAACGRASVDTLRKTDAEFAAFQIF